VKHTLSIDLETYSPVDIKYGVYKYAEQAEILLFAYSLDGQPPVCIDSGLKFLDDWLCNALIDPNYTKKAFNASFERAILNAFYGIYTPPEQWECTLARAAMCGLPLSLDDSSKALGLIEKKDPVGKALIRFFSMPCKPSKANDFRTRNLPEHDPEKWQQFIEYCKQDIVVEQNVDKACQWYKIPAVEHHIWCLNERKNERGVLVDMELIDSAIIINKEFREELIEEATELSGLSNVNSPKQLKEWLSAEMEEEVTTLNKLAVRQMLLDETDPAVRRILHIRQLMSKSSITKYLALKYGACEDLRVRGMIQYYGANRTGREAGRGPQPQNFPRLEDIFQEDNNFLDDTRELVKRRDVDSLRMIFPNLSSIISQMLRPTFIAAPGKELVVLDFSSIESLACACLAGEQWRIDFFKTGGDIYKASGSVMFHVPVDKITKDVRQKCKIAELLCQYGGGAGAMERNNDTIEDPKKRIPVEEIPRLIKTWRKANPAIVQMWWDMDAAAKLAINTGQLVPVKNGVAFGMKNGNLLMKLPSGRCLVYQKAFLQKFYIAKVPVVDDKLLPKIHFDEENNPYVKFLSVKIGKVQKDTPEEYQYLLKRAGLAYDTSRFNEYLQEFGLTYEKPKPGKRETVCFWGMDGIWKVVETYGPKFFENLVQAACRDLLMHSVINVEKAGYPVVLTVHDEFVAEVLKSLWLTLDKVKEIMLQLPDWASWWPVRADGFIGDYYMK